MKALIVYDRIDSSRPDEADTLEEAENVIASLARLGIATETAEFHHDIDQSRDILSSRDYDFIFNLVESVNGKGMLIHLATTCYDLIGSSYTGNSNETMFITSNKIASKRIMRLCGIPTAEWIEPGNISILKPDGKKYIIKSCWEHASIGIDDNSIFVFDSLETVSKAFECKMKELGPLVFAERFISGREFNISVLADDSGKMRVLTPAEMKWDGCAAGDNIMNYQAKWVEDTTEYDVTRRSFAFSDADASLLNSIVSISARCSDVFSLNGYARVDFRVEGDQPYVLEVNANPCLSPESGIAAAARHVGIGYDELIKLIVDNRICR